MFDLPGRYRVMHTDEAMTAVVPRGEHFVALAIVRSLGHHMIDTFTLSPDPNAMTFASKYCGKKEVCSTPADYLKTLSRQHLVMPTDEGIMIELAKHPEQYSCSFAFPPYRILNPLMDKGCVIDTASEIGIPTPDTLSPGDLTHRHVPFPAVIKPKRGLGGVGISFASSPAELKEMVRSAEDRFGPVLIQEKIPYQRRYSVALLLNNEHETRLSCVLEAIRCNPAGTGPACCVESVIRPDLVEMSERLLSAMNYTGVAELEFVIDSRTGTPRLMEINPRFWGSLQGAISAGVEFPSGLFRLFRDGDIEKGSGYRAGVRTRNVLVNDYQNLRDILRGNYPIGYKVDSIREFLRFYRDDAYYIFDRQDIRPFLAVLLHSYRKRRERIAGVFSRQTIPTIG